jgi:streptogramin lyase
MTRRSSLLFLGLTVIFGSSAGAATQPVSAMLSVHPTPIEAHVPWSATITVRRGGRPYEGRAPRIETRLRSTIRTFASRRIRPGAFRARVVFPTHGRWAFAVRFAARRLPLGTISVAPGLTNVLDVAVLPNDSLLVSDEANYVYRARPGGRLTIVAGNGRGGSGGDGGLAVAARVGFPVEVAPDPRGGFSIVSDERFVRRVDPQGRIRTIAKLAQPAAQAYDANGNLYVSELAGRVKRIDDRTGEVTTLASGLDQPHGLVVDRDGGLIVCETFGNRLVRIDLDTRAVRTLASGLQQPNDVALSKGGSFYVSAFRSNSIERVTGNGRVTRVTGAAGPNAVAVDAAGRIYYTELGLPRVRRFDPTTGRSVIVLGR